MRSCQRSSTSFRSGQMEAGVVATRLNLHETVHGNRIDNSGVMGSIRARAWVFGRSPVSQSNPVVKTGVTTINKEELFTAGCMEGVRMTFVIRNPIHCLKIPRLVRYSRAKYKS